MNEETVKSLIICGVGHSIVMGKTGSEKLTIFQDEADKLGLSYEEYCRRYVKQGSQ